MKNPVPDNAYSQKQRQHKKLLDQPGGGRDVSRKLYADLESQFMKAWGLERYGKAQARSIRALAGGVCEGFDHCTYYCELDTSDLIIATQPYSRADRLVKKMERGLSLGNWLRPQII